MKWQNEKFLKRKYRFLKLFSSERPVEKYFVKLFLYNSYINRNLIFWGVEKCVELTDFLWIQLHPWKKIPFSELKNLSPMHENRQIAIIFCIFFTENIQKKQWLFWLSNFCQKQSRVNFPHYILRKKSWNHMCNLIWLRNAKKRSCHWKMWTFVLKEWFVWPLLCSIFVVCSSGLTQKKQQRIFTMWASLYPRRPKGRL